MYFGILGVTRNEIPEIFSAFGSIESDELRSYKEYRTQNLVLHEFDRLTLAEASGDPYDSLRNLHLKLKAAPSYSPHGVIQDAADAHLAGLMLTIIQQATRLPRRELSQALTLATQQNLLDRFIDAQGIALLRQFMQQHPGVFDSARLAGGRIQQWIRHFEATGIIRLNAASDTIELVQAVALPSDVQVTGASAQVAVVLIQAANQTFAEMDSVDQKSAATPAAKQG